MSADLLRRTGRAALDVLRWPIAAVVTVLIAGILFSPRRAPDLARLTRSACFGDTHSAATTWTDRSFELIEAGAPWLDRIGRRVSDYCATDLSSRPLSIPRDPPSVTCRRNVTVVYGFDGPLPGQLSELTAVLSAAGWGDRHEGTTAVLQDLNRRERPVQGVAWSPAQGHRLPAGLETMPPGRTLPLTRWLSLGIDWVSRGAPALQEPSLYGGRPVDPLAATATCQPVQVDGADAGRLTSQALERHEHAVAVCIEMTYYLNANANARPGRLRKRLLPVFLASIAGTAAAARLHG
jgi:hypothetical protein